MVGSYLYFYVEVKIFIAVLNVEKERNIILRCIKINCVFVLYVWYQIPTSNNVMALCLIKYSSTLYLANKFYIFHITWLMIEGHDLTYKCSKDLYM